MSLSESLLQSQIALNSQIINMWEHLLTDIDISYKEGIAEKIYYSGLKATKEYRKSLYAVWYAHRKPYKDKIAKYTKLQKALKAELKAVRQQKAMVRAFLNKKNPTEDIQLCGKESQVFWGNILREE